MSFLQGLFGPPDVEKLRDKGDVKGLIKALRYNKDELIRRNAEEALGKIGAPAVEPLVNSLRKLANTKENQDVRDAIVAALVKVGEPAVKLLVVTIQNPKEYFFVQDSARDALKRIGPPAVEPLIAALRIPDLVYGVIEVLGQIGDARAVEPLIAFLRANSPSAKNSLFAFDHEREALESIGPAAVGPLIAALGDNDPHVRKALVETLGKIGDERAVEPLIGTLRDNDKEVRYASVEPLGRIGGVKAVEPLISTLRDEDPNIRKRAVEMLGKIGAVRAIDPLIQIRNDKDERVRKEVLNVLLKMNATLPEKRILFPCYTGDGGQCNVCDKPLPSGDAYLVPKDVFYSSRKYKEFVPKTLAGAFTSMLGGDVDLYIASALKTEKRTEIGVCSSCIHLFE